MSNAMLSVKSVKKNARECNEKTLDNVAAAGRKAKCMKCNNEGAKVETSDIIYLS